MKNTRHSYKQEEAPRYHARDVAVVRAKIEKCVVVLGTRDAVARELSQRAARQIRAEHTDPAGRCKARCRSCASSICARSGGKKRQPPFLSEKLRTAIARSAGEARADDSVSEPTRFLHLAPLQQLWEGARLPELQRRAHLSSARNARLSCHLCGHTAAVPKRCPASAAKTR